MTLSFDLDRQCIILTFYVYPDVIQVHPHTKVHDPQSNGLAIKSAERVTCWGIESNKTNKQETPAKITDHTLHLPNLFSNQRLL